MHASAHAATACPGAVYARVSNAGKQNAPRRVLEVTARTGRRCVPLIRIRRVRVAVGRGSLGIILITLRRVMLVVLMMRVILRGSVIVVIRVRRRSMMVGLAALSLGRICIV